MEKCRIDILGLEGPELSMCHIFRLNVEFGNACRFAGCPVSLFNRLAFSIPAFLVAPVLTRTNRVLEVARIFTKHSKRCDKFFVLSISLYAFMSQLYKQLFSFCKIYTVFVGSLFYRLAHKMIPYAVCWKASKTSKTLISKRRTLGDIAIRLTFRTTRLKVNIDSPRDNRKFDLRY